MWAGVPKSVVADTFARLEQGFGFRLEVPSALPGVLAAAFPWRDAADHRALMQELEHAAVIIPIVRDREAGRVTIDRRGRAGGGLPGRGVGRRGRRGGGVGGACPHPSPGGRGGITPPTKTA